MKKFYKRNSTKEIFPGEEEEVVGDCSKTAKLSIFSGKKNGIGQIILKCIGILLGLIGIYSIAMILVFMLPEDKVKQNIENSQVTLNSEGAYPLFYVYTNAGTLDNVTDALMLQKTLKLEGVTGKLDAAFSVAGYARYWHGYVTYLKPMLMFMDYNYIRICLGFLHFMLICFSFSCIQKRFGWKVSVPFLVAWISSYGMLAAFSLQYTAAYAIYLLASIFMIQFYKKDSDNSFLLYFFMIVGSVINFFDFLTFPIITLTVPLILALLVGIIEGNDTFRKSIKKVGIATISWGIGYGFTWIAKWCLANIFLNGNTIENAISSILFRTQGSVEQPIDRIAVMNWNKDLMIILRTFLKSPIPWIVLLIYILLRKRIKKTLSYMVLLIVATYPYIWYQVLCNHSMFHCKFTYKAQIGTLFAILVFFMYLIFPLNIKLLTHKKKKIKLE
ncbi:MAG: hypothetical protein RR238_10235 [Lachnospiraceae bacterium]